MNSVNIAGNVGKDPEVKNLTNGDMMVSFSLATGHGDYTQWHNCIAFKKCAELISKHVRKGAKLACTGSIEYRVWDKEDGTKGYATQIVVHTISFMDSKAKSNAPVAQESNVPDDLPFK